MNTRFTRFVGAFVLTVALAATFSQSTAYAQFDFMPKNDNLRAANFNTAEDFVGIIINLFLGFALSISIIGILFAGIKMIWSKGDPKAMEVGRNYFNYAIRALILSIVAIALEALIRDILGVSGPDVAIGLPK